MKFLGKILITIAFFLFLSLATSTPVLAACSVSNPTTVNGGSAFGVTVQTNESGSFNQLFISNVAAPVEVDNNSSGSVTFSVGPLPPGTYTFTFVRFLTKTNPTMTDTCSSAAGTKVDPPVGPVKKFYCHDPNTNKAACSEVALAAASGPYPDNASCQTACPLVKNTCDPSIFDINSGSHYVGRSCPPLYCESTCDTTVGSCFCYEPKVLAEPTCPSGSSWLASLKCCATNNQCVANTVPTCSYPLVYAEKFGCVRDTPFKATDIQGSCGEGFVDTAIGCIPTAKFTDTMGFVMRWIFLVAGGIIIALIIKNGYTLLTSAGNPEKLKEVRESVTAIVTGILLIIFSLTILRIVGADILGLPGF